MITRDGSEPVATGPFGVTRNSTSLPRTQLARPAKTPYSDHGQRANRNSAPVQLNTFASRGRQKPLRRHQKTIKTRMPDPMPDRARNSGYVTLTSTSFLANAINGIR